MTRWSLLPCIRLGREERLGQACGEGVGGAGQGGCGAEEKRGRSGGDGGEGWGQGGLLSS